MSTECLFMGQHRCLLQQVERAAEKDSFCQLVCDFHDTSSDSREFVPCAQAGT